MQRAYLTPYSTFPPEYLTDISKSMCLKLSLPPNSAPFFNICFSSYGLWIIASNR